MYASASLISIGPGLRSTIIVTQGCSDEAADKVAQASDVLCVRHIEPVIDGQRRACPSSPPAHENYPEATADQRTGFEWHGSKIKQQGRSQRTLVSLP
jgi:hypothetical protein